MRMVLDSLGLDLGRTRNRRTNMSGNSKGEGKCQPGSYFIPP